MRLNSRITVYDEVTTKYDPVTNKYVETKSGEEVYQCNVSVVKDYIDDVAVGRLTGKTIKARFIQPIGTFNYAEYGGKTYKPSGYTGSKNKMSVLLEEVVV